MGCSIPIVAAFLQTISRPTDSRAGNLRYPVIPKAFPSAERSEAEGPAHRLCGPETRDRAQATGAGRLPSAERSEAEGPAHRLCGPETRDRAQATGAGRFRGRWHGAKRSDGRGRLPFHSDYTFMCSHRKVEGTRPLPSFGKMASHFAEIHLPLNRAWRRWGRLFHERAAASRLECVSKIPNVHFRCLRLHFCVAFPRLASTGLPAPSR